MCSTVLWGSTGFCTWTHSIHEVFCIDGASSECVPLWCGVPRGSVLEPIIFTMYFAPFNRIHQMDCSSYHTYADDIYVYVSFNPNIESDKERYVGRLVASIREVRKWMLLHRLKLNGGKMEPIRLISKQNKAMLFPAANSVLGVAT